MRCYESFIPWMLMVNAVRKSEYGFNRFTQSRLTHTHTLSETWLATLQKRKMKWWTLTRKTEKPTQTNFAVVCRRRCLSNVQYHLMKWRKCSNVVAPPPCMISRFSSLRCEESNAIWARHTCTIHKLFKYVDEGSGDDHTSSGNCSRRIWKIQKCENK